MRLTATAGRRTIGGVGDLAKFARQLQRIELVDQERVLDAWVAGVPYGERSNATKTGGTLVLTNRRLIFQPLDPPLPVVSQDGAIRPDEAWRAWIDESYFAIELGEVREVDADTHRRSALVLATPSGSRALNVGASRFSSTFSKKNVAVRDAAIAAIRNAVDRK